MNRLMLAAVAVLLPVAAHAGPQRPQDNEWLPPCRNGTWTVFTDFHEFARAKGGPKFFFQNDGDGPFDQIEIIWSNGPGQENLIHLRLNQRQTGMVVCMPSGAPAS